MRQLRNQFPRSCLPEPSSRTLSYLAFRITESGDTTGDYLMIKILDTYNQSEAPFGYTVPGAGETITISFTVSGMAE